MMTHEEQKYFGKIPEPTLRRLPWYLAYVKLLKKRGNTVISSTQIAKEISVDSSLVAKDLSFVNVSGKTRVGYEIDTLIQTLENFLGFTSQHKAFIFGVGRLGAALIRDTGLNQYGLNIVAGFDVRNEVIDSEIDGIPVFCIDQLPAKQEIFGASIGIITVPVENAQAVADYVIEKGIRALWNFTPYRIRVPETIVVQNTSIYAHLAVMFNRMNDNNNNINSNLS